MRLIRDFILSHPWNSAMLIGLLFLAGLADGLGLSAMMPMLNLAFDSDTGATGAASANTGAAADPASEDNLTTLVYSVIEAAGLTPSLGVLLCMIVAGITFKSLLVFIAEQRIGYLAADVATGLRVQLLRAITASSWRFYVNQSVGKLANSMATEAWRASNAYVYAIRLTVVFIETLVYFGVALLVFRIFVLEKRQPAKSTP